MPRKVNPPPVNPILIGELPLAIDQALSTFERLLGNTYQTSALGKWAGHDEGTNCDCRYVPGRNPLHEACGEGSDCINRLTLVECIEGDCPSRAFCQNRRFQRREYADVSVVQTEKKGFGLRAESQIDRDALIYEYIGEVVKETEFMKRMARYAQEGIKHFYFMMLQKEQYIDATKKGDIGRFANHSCNPNCYVSKWFVGARVRMGIFAKRTIRQHEELTFNYNVDRYGHDAQECYCEEPNCIGFIGGKTQTDIGGMDDLYIEALGITDDVEKYTLKGTRRKKGRKIDEDYLPTLSPIVEEEAPILLQALRQSSSSNPKMLPHLLSRLEKTTDADALRNVMRLRGFSLMHSLLDELKDELNIVKMILKSMTRWPLINRNKVEDSNIEDLVKQIAVSDDEEVRGVSEKLLNLWSGLETAYRIPRRAMQLEEIDGQPLRFVPALERAPKRLRDEDDESIETQVFKYTAVTPAKVASLDVSGIDSPKPNDISSTSVVRSAVPSKNELDAIIARATEAAAASAALQAEKAAEEKAATEKLLAAKQRRKERAARKEREKESSREKTKGKVKEKEDKHLDKDKRLVKLVGEVVVKYMSRHRDKMNHEEFKKHAKELTHLIAEKEKKSTSYKEGILTSLSDEKRQKMKKFVGDYIKKVLKRKQVGATGSPNSKRFDERASMEPVKTVVNAGEGMGADILVEEWGGNDRPPSQVSESDQSMSIDGGSDIEDLPTHGYDERISGLAEADAVPPTA